MTLVNVKQCDPGHRDHTVFLGQKTKSPFPLRGNEPDAVFIDLSPLHRGRIATASVGCEMASRNSFQKEI